MVQGVVFSSSKIIFVKNSSVPRYVSIVSTLQGIFNTNKTVQIIIYMDNEYSFFLLFFGETVGEHWVQDNSKTSSTQQHIDDQKNENNNSYKTIITNVK